MKRVKEIMKERESWIEVVSDLALKKSFGKLENHVEEHQMEFWDQLFLQVPENLISEAVRDALSEQKQADVYEKYESLVDEVKKETANKLSKNLNEYGWKIGKKQKEWVLGNIEDTTIKEDTGIKGKKILMLNKFFLKNKKEGSIKQIEMKEEVNEESIE